MAYLTVVLHKWRDKLFTYLFVLNNNYSTSYTISSAASICGTLPATSWDLMMSILNRHQHVQDKLSYCIILAGNNNSWSHWDILFSQRRLHINLCLMYKIIDGLMYFPPDIVTPSTTWHITPDPFYFRSHLYGLMLISILFYLDQHLTGTHYLICLFCHLI